MSDTPKPVRLQLSRRKVVRFGDAREEMVFRRLQRALRLTDDQFVALVKVAVDQISPNRRKNAANPSPAEDGSPG